MQDYSPSFYSFRQYSVVLTEITSAPDDESIGIEYCQNKLKSIADTHFDTPCE